MTSAANRRLVVGITGASGVIYGTHLVRQIHQLTALQDVEAHVVMSPAAKRTIKEELIAMTPQIVDAWAYQSYAHGDIGAAIASGSFQTMGMVVAPCSANTLAHIAHGFQDNLITRAAAVTLKERRRLVLVYRETPLTEIDLENMLKVTKAGGIIVPPVPAWYIKPESPAAIYYHTVGRILDLFGLDVYDLQRWTGPEGS
jgi:4-hydroxy-3-polyprenylbenzoate decarboxylase